jgi:O-succinylbenzoic acid--CoA ligase
VDPRQHLAGVGPGDLVAVALAPGPAWPPILAELWSRGAAVLPIDPRLRPAERRDILDRARPGLVLDADQVTVRTDARAVEDGTALAVATSGTAGSPKVVELSRRAVEAAVHASAEALRTSVAEPWLCCLPVAHIGGLMVLMRGVVTGAPVVVHVGFNAREVAAADVAHVALVPTMVRRLLDAGAGLGHLRTIVVGGARLPDPDADAARAAGGNVVTSYGLTETGGGIAYDGRLLGGTSARPGSDGELEVAGPTVMRGYLGDPTATAGAFTLDGWLRTGDVGAVTDDGRLHVVGRLDDRIRTGAETVWPHEVEAVLRDHPNVAEVAVAGRPDAEWGSHVVAYVVPVRVDRPPTLEDLRDHVAERIARFKAPREIVLLPKLPRTASGKVLRSRLR